MKKIRGQSEKNTFTEKDAAKAFSKHLNSKIEVNQVRVLSHNIHDKKVFAIQIGDHSYLCSSSDKYDCKIIPVSWED